MKKQFSLITRSAVAVLAVSAVCFAGRTSAQTSEASPTSEGNAPASEMAKKGQTARDANADETGAPRTKASKAAKSMDTQTSGGSLAQKDRDFVMMAAKGGMMEVHMGQMAEKQGQSADVKKLGARMVADHTKVNTELMALAQSKGVKLDTRHKMDKMDSANFDQMWLDSMVKDHEKDIAAFQMEAKSGMDPQLKSFAGKNLPTLQKHLQMVKAAQSKMSKKS